MKFTTTKQWRWNTQQSLLGLIITAQRFQFKYLEFHNLFLFFPKPEALCFFWGCWRTIDYWYFKKQIRWSIAVELLTSTAAPELGHSAGVAECLTRLGHQQRDQPQGENNSVSCGSVFWRKDGETRTKMGRPAFCHMASTNIWKNLQTQNLAEWRSCAASGERFGSRWWW